jgi:hypothetical protein
MLLLGGFQILSAICLSWWWVLFWCGSGVLPWLIQLPHPISSFGSKECRNLLLNTLLNMLDDASSCALLVIVNFITAAVTVVVAAAAVIVVGYFVDAVFVVTGSIRWFSRDEIPNVSVEKAVVFRCTPWTLMDNWFHRCYPPFDDSVVGL